MLKLTKRELEILKLFCYKNEEIANILTLGVTTVKTHVSHILKKLNEPTKIKALIKAIKMGIINIYSVETSYVDVGFWDTNGKYKIDIQRFIDNEQK